jgi:hypothetical protein
MGDHLEMISKVITNKVEVDVNDWASIQKAVRMGVAPNVLPVGTQLVANHSVYGDIVLDVVAHDHYESVDIKGTHTMTLMCHDIITSIRFDEREAFYYAEEELPIGTYHFYVSPTSSNAGCFTLDQPLAKGGLLFIYGNYDYSIDSSEILAYDTMSQTVPRTYDITLGKEGTSLGTLGVELNQAQRVFYGSNNYKESAVRQFINSSVGAGNVWSPQTKYDFRPEWKDVLAGFGDGFSEDFLSKVGRVLVPCSANNTYESSDSTVVKGQKYIVVDKFFLPSQTELFGTSTNIIEDGSALLPFFKNASNADRIKYSGAYPSRYWLRSAEYGNAISVGAVETTGSLIGRNANDSYGIVPMFNIV